MSRASSTLPERASQAAKKNCASGSPGSSRTSCMRRLRCARSFETSSWTLWVDMPAVTAPLPRPAITLSLSQSGLRTSVWREGATERAHEGLHLVLARRPREEGRESGPQDDAIRAGAAQVRRLLGGVQVRSRGDGQAPVADGREHLAGLVGQELPAAGGRVAEPCQHDPRRLRGDPRCPFRPAARADGLHEVEVDLAARRLQGSARVYGEIQDEEPAAPGLPPTGQEPPLSEGLERVRIGGQQEGRRRPLPERGDLLEERVDAAPPLPRPQKGSAQLRSLQGIRERQGEREDIGAPAGRRGRVGEAPGKVWIRDRDDGDDGPASLPPRLIEDRLEAAHDAPPPEITTTTNASGPRSRATALAAATPWAASAETRIPSVASSVRKAS